MTALNGRPADRTGWPSHPCTGYVGFLVKLVARCVLGLVTGALVVSTACGPKSPLGSADATASPAALKHSLGVGGGGYAPNPPPCGKGMGPLAYLAALKPSHTAEELTAAGYRVYPEMATKPHATVTASDRVVVVMSGDPNVQISLAKLRSNSAVAQAGVVFPQDPQPGMCSTSYQLDDAPALHPYVVAGETAIRAHALTTQASMDGGILLLSEDPLDSNDLIFTVAVGDPAIQPGYPPGVEVHALIPIIAFIDRKTVAVARMGYGAWYEGQQ